MLAIQLKPLSPFHLQTGGLDHESVDNFPKSDTLSAALTYLWARQFNEVPGLPGNLPFRLSSAFPMVFNGKNGSWVRLFPKPGTITFDLFCSWVGSELFNHKEFKKIQWLDEGLFKLALVDAGSLKKYAPTSPDNKKLWCNGTVWCKEESGDDNVSGNLTDTNEITRVVLDRQFSTATPFHFVTTVFPEHTNLFFIADVEKEFQDTFLMLFRLLGDEGLGADRTVGMGRFEVVSVEDWSYAENGTPKAWISLGLMNPTPDSQKMMQWNESSYSLINRSGWVTGKALRRRSVRMLVEASVFVSDKKPEGRIMNVLDKDVPNILDRHRKYLSEVAELSHPVYRDGRTILLPINLSQV